MEWNSRKEKVLKVWSKNPISECGQFSIQQLTEPPPQIEWIMLEADEQSGQ